MAIRISQHGIEVSRTNTAVPIRVSQVVVETIRLATAHTIERVSQITAETVRLRSDSPLIRVSQVVMETIRRGIPSNNRVFPVQHGNRVWYTGAGTRVFPI